MVLNAADDSGKPDSLPLIGWPAAVAALVGAGSEAAASSGHRCSGKAGVSVRILRPVSRWYHFGMSKQIAVRLSDYFVEFVVQMVDCGSQRIRAAVVTRALERERRRMIALRDAEILAASGPDPELSGLVDFAVHVSTD